jgi:hypothetical protein
MTNRPKEITMRYSGKTDREIKEVTISETDTVRVILSRLKAKSNFHLADSEDKPFGIEDIPFGYVSIPSSPPLKLLHGSALRGKVRESTPRKDNRIAVEVHFEGNKAVFPRGVQPTYTTILEHAATNFGMTTPVCLERIRADEDRILVDIKLGDEALWFIEKACPPLNLSDDKIYAESVGTGGWGSISPSSPMQTRAAVAAAAPKKADRIKDVLLHNLETDEMEPIGRATEYEEALKLARNSGKVPKGQNLAVSDCNDERILVVCKKGVIVSGDGVVTKPKPAVTPPKPKQKKETILPEKLVGPPKNPEAAFAPRRPTPDVPGVLNTLIVPSTFKKCNPRPLSPDVGHWDIKVEILREQTRKIRVRQDSTSTEILAQAFLGVDITDEERAKIVAKPMKMENGATFVVERCSIKAHLALTIEIWDGSSRRCGVEVCPTAMLKEIVDQAQLKIEDERLEEDHRYVILHNNTPAARPWIHKEYELRPTENARGMGVVQGRFGEMTIPLPLFQKSRWEQIIRSSLFDQPLAIVQLEQLKFRVYYRDEKATHRVRYETTDIGEEHLIDLFPQWENQVHENRYGLGREMIPDDSKQSTGDIIYVKEADGSPPDPQFERIMKYTLGENSEEYDIRVKKDQTTRDVKERIKSLHAGINPAKILFEGSAMDDAYPVNEWATTTGTSPSRVSITLDHPIQRFQVWQSGEIYDMGAEDLNGRPKEDIWRSLEVRNPLLKNIEDYKLFVGQKGSQWGDLPVLNVTLVPNGVPMVTRGSEFRTVD